MNVAVIGAGSWGTALALVLAEAGHDVMLWARTPAVADSINADGRNPRHLSDYRLPAAIRATADYAEATDGAEAVVIVTPSAALRSVARDLAPLVGADTPVVICSKGVEEETGLLPIDTFAAELGNAERMAVLSGPTHAEEVICRKPAAPRRRRCSSATCSPRGSSAPTPPTTPWVWSCAPPSRTSSPSPWASATAWASATTRRPCSSPAAWPK